MKYLLLIFFPIFIMADQPIRKEIKIVQNGVTIVGQFLPHSHKLKFLICGFKCPKVITAQVKIKNETVHQMDFTTKMLKIKTTKAVIEGYFYMPIADDYLGNYCDNVKINPNDSLVIQIDWKINEGLPESISEYEFLYDPNACYTN